MVVFPNVETFCPLGIISFSDVFFFIWSGHTVIQIQFMISFQLLEVLSFTLYTLTSEDTKTFCDLDQYVAFCMSTKVMTSVSGYRVVSNQIWCTFQHYLKILPRMQVNFMALAHFYGLLT